MGKTSIEWADYTVNPIRARNLETGAVGHFCEKVSPECAHCYASDWNERVRPQASGKLIGTGLSFIPVNRAKVETFLDREKLAEVLNRKTPTTYFWCDMTDLFGEWVPDAMIDACYVVMALTPRHTHMILTKRAQRMRDYFLAPDLYGRILAAAAYVRAFRPELGTVGISDPVLHPPRWIYKGVSTGNQKSADDRISWLLKTPAAVRYISAEPLLGRLDLSGFIRKPNGWKWAGGVECRHGYDACPRCDANPEHGLDLVIDGGESGPRLSHPDWFRSLRDQCQAAGVKYFHKQNGDWKPGSNQKKKPMVVMLNDGRAMTEAQYCASFSQTPAGLNPSIMSHVGKKAAGRMLDGREWNEMPAVARA